MAQDGKREMRSVTQAREPWSAESRLTGKELVDSLLFRRHMRPWRLSSTGISSFRREAAWAYRRRWLTRDWSRCVNTGDKKRWKIRELWWRNSSPGGFYVDFFFSSRVSDRGDQMRALYIHSSATLKANKLKQKFLYSRSFWSHWKLSEAVLSR